MNFDFKKEYGAMTGIYVITNNINGKKYIGQTLRSFISRYCGHKNKAFCNKSKKSYVSNKLYNSIRKYGWDNFSFDILHFCDDKSNIDDLEKGYIVKFETLVDGLNLDSGGNLHKFRSAETRRKMSKAKMGNKYGAFPCSDEAKKKIGLASKGNKVWLGRKHTSESKKKMVEIKKNQSQETKQKISRALMGHKHSASAREKMSKSHKGKKCPWKKGSFTEDQIQKSIKKRSIPVFMFNDKEVLEYFPSILAAAKWLSSNNIVNSKHPEVCIRSCCIGKYKKAYGYKWMRGLSS